MLYFHTVHTYPFTCIITIPFILSTYSIPIIHTLIQLCLIHYIYIFSLMLYKNIMHASQTLQVSFHIYQTYIHINHAYHTYAVHLLWASTHKHRQQILRKVSPIDTRSTANRYSNVSLIDTRKYRHYTFIILINIPVSDICLCPLISHIFLYSG